MSKAILLHRNGGPEVLSCEEVEVAPPAAGEVQIRQAAVGVNFIDVYHRSGLYPLPLPSGLGLEGAGEVAAVGAGVEGFAAGDRVAYTGGPIGAYVELRNLPADKLLQLPAGIDFETAAGMMLRGLTAQYLLRRTYRVKPGDTVLIHAAAGGLGLLMCQWAKALGATVIGTVGSPDKAGLARAHGCDHPIDYRQEDFVARVRELTTGVGVPVVYDSIGRDTFQASLDCLQPLGLMVSLGNASGAMPAFELAELARRGSLFITRPTLFSYAARRSDLEAMAAELFAVVGSGQVQIRIGQRYPLAAAAQAHRDLESRQTTGSTILVI
jgi:NADPH:quinone reductase